MSAPDINYRSFAGLNGQMFLGLTFDPENSGADYDDIFKLSHCTNCSFTGVSVQAGKARENAQDLNSGSCDNEFTDLLLAAGKQCAILVKGGSSRNRWENVVITKAGGHSDVFLGDYSDQSRSKSSGNHFNLVRRLDGKPVRVSWTFFRAERPVFTNSKVRYQYALSLARTLYVEAKYLWKRFCP